MTVRITASLLVLSALVSSAVASAAPVCVSQKGKLICQVTESCLAEMSSAEESATELSKICVGDRVHLALSLNPTLVGEVFQVNSAAQVTLRLDGTGSAMAVDYVEVSAALSPLSSIFKVGECVSVASAYGRGRVTAKIQELFSDNLVLLTTLGLGETRMEQVYRIQKSPDCTASQ